ncbi:hypothetical protein PILCRDRAFT_828312 [Piloderma croceum F 1598]|uniref:DUF6534 domain-containing protein n=1 Tax=Piloderma croceum (strain F 1598) TaxID=765440 RepID=A0A0C3F2L8_PILCF|nr:hypothetical protein PILCRDRAFT_828312 [Piloderma croceum F 1598]
MEKRAPSLSESLGAAYLGVVLSSILFGITTLQVYIYYQHYPADKLKNRIVVPLLWIMDAFHLSMIINASYVYLVNQLPLNSGIILRMQLEIVATELIAVTVTSLYVLRIWAFARQPRRYIVCFLAVAEFLQITAAIVEVYACFTCPNLGDMINFLWEIEFGLASHAFVDVLLAGTMCFYLQKGRTDTSFKTLFSLTRGIMPHSTDGTVVKLMQYIVGSGTATALCAIATVTATAISPYSMIWTACYYLLSKLYVNSFLAFLNARQSIRRRMEDSSISPPAPISDVRFAGPESSSQGSLASRHHNDSKAGHSLVMFNDSASPEGSVGEQQPKASTLLTV